MADQDYIKLTPPRQRGRIAIVSSQRSNLWLGQDHVLCVETEGYTESYKRFYFRDIQAITLRRTERMRILAAVTGGMTAIFGALALAMSAIEGRWLFGILAGVCAIPFVLNFLYGPTCACQLRTAVQTEAVPSMGRIRRARKVLARLRPLIAEAQGQIAAEEIPLRLQEFFTSPVAAVSEPPITGTTDVPPPATS